MGLTNLGQTNQKTRDEISNPSSSEYPQIVIFSETLNLIEGTTVIQTEEDSGCFVLSHADYGILGTSAMNLPPAGITVRVTNPNNEYKEYIYSDFMFSTASTATINTTTQEITF